MEKFTSIQIPYYHYRFFFFLFWQAILDLQVIPNHKTGTLHKSRDYTSITSWLTSFPIIILISTPSSNLASSPWQLSTGYSGL